MSARLRDIQPLPWNADMEEKPRKCRRLQFNLSTVFLMLTVAAFLLAVAVPVASKAIRAREEARRKAIEAQVQEEMKARLRAMMVD